MAKKQKTREQKKQSDFRRQSHYSYTPGMTEVKISDSPTRLSPSSKTPSSSYAVSTSGYKYLSGDLLKTTILTASILLIELTLKLFTNGV